MQGLAHMSSMMTGRGSFFVGGIYKFRGGICVIIKVKVPLRRCAKPGELPEQKQQDSVGVERNLDRASAVVYFSL
jgi:hypothetical protein